MKYVWMVMLAAAAFGTGCERTAKFKVAFGDGLDEPIEARVNGNVVGVVSPGFDEEFEVRLRVLQSSPTGPDQTDVAQATLTARTIKTNRLSYGETRTIYRDRTEYKRYGPWDFPDP